jgi:hypothetical protein
MITLIAASVLSAALAAKPRRRRHAPVPREISVAAERIERRRVVRLAIIAALTRRESELEDFLASAATETPLLSIRESHTAGPLQIGPTFVGIDFLGSPIVRATVANHSSAKITAILVAHLADGAGRESAASVAVSNISPGEARTVELLCPASMLPTVLRWTVERF